MTRKLNTVVFVATVLGGFVAVTVTPASAGPKDMFPPSTPHRSMSDSGGMSDMMGPISPDHMKQMTRMMNDCNAMMKSARNVPHRAR